MSSGISPTRIRAVCEAELNVLVSDEYAAKRDVQPSPELLDLLIWNVVINFFVSVMGNAAFHVMRGTVTRLRDNGRLTRKDLNELAHELDTTVVMANDYQRAGVEADLGTCLLDFGISESRAPELARPSYKSSLR